MRMQTTLCCQFALAAVLCAASCRGPAADTRSATGSAGDGKPTVYVVNYPLYYFAERIAGGAVEVVFPAPGDVDPADWHPSDETVAGFQNADLILLNGAGYAHWTGHVSLPPNRLVDTSRELAGKLIAGEGKMVHSHGPGGEHSHHGTAFTTWLDPRQAMLQAEQVRAALVALVPAQAAQLEANARQLEADLAALDDALSEAVAAYDDQPLLASHPVYQYLARRCGWQLKSVHWEPRQLPDDAQWRQLDKLLESHPARWMIWEGPPPDETAARLESRGVACLVFYPCGNTPPEGDYLSVMQANIQRLKQISAGHATPAAGEPKPAQGSDA